MHCMCLYQHILLILFNVKLIYFSIMVSLVFFTVQVETLSREDLASRLTLNVDAASIGTLLVSDSSITVMDVSD